jgi:hypothetical protein
MAKILQRTATEQGALAGAEPQERAERVRMTRHRMRAIWDTVERMLTDPKAPRRDAAGRDVFEVWADLVLQNPPLEFARVANEILPPEPSGGGENSLAITNIQSLYLTAVQAANRAPDPRIVAQVEGTVTESNKVASEYTGSTPDLSDW